MDISNEIAAIQERMQNLYPLISDSYINWFKKQAKHQNITINEEKVIAVAKAMKHLHVLFFHVPSEYYSWTLRSRQLCLNAPSSFHLCKSVLFENTRWNSNVFTSETHKHQRVTIKLLF